jgi:hypothetical protein
MGTRKHNGSNNGNGNGGDNGQAQRGVLPMEDFCALVGANLAACKRDALVSRVPPDRVGNGARMGTVPLEPLETLEDRVAGLWPGAHVLRIVARQTNGSFAAATEVELAGAPATATPAAAAPDAMVAALLKQNAELQAELRAVLTRPAAPSTDPVDQLAKLVAVVATLVPKAPPPPLPPPPPPTPVEQLAALKETLNAVQSIAGKFGGPEKSAGAALVEAMAPGLADLTKGAGALIFTRIAERAEAFEKRKEPPPPEPAPTSPAVGAA